MNGYAKARRHLYKELWVTHYHNLVLALQITLYVLTLAGYLWQRKGRPPPILSIPFSFCLVNLSALVGVGRFVMGKKSGRWEPVRA